jgi:hypothetical protein
MGLAVEHIQPKSLNPSLENEWENFLLSCPSCNSRKGQKDINADNFHDYFWPHIDNTYRAFNYETNQAPKPADSLTEIQKLIAQRTLELTGLNQEKVTNSTEDKRHKNRNEAWSEAEKYKQNLLKRPADIEYRNLLTDYAVSRGFWSVWMTVFQDEIDMRNRLIKAFKGTSVDCFDAEAHPLQREGGKI